MASLRTGNDNSFSPMDFQDFSLMGAFLFPQVDRNTYVVQNKQNRKPNKESKYLSTKCVLTFAVKCRNKKNLFSDYLKLLLKQFFKEKKIKNKCPILWIGELLNTNNQNNIVINRIF